MATTTKYDQLAVTVYEDAQELGAAAAEAFSRIVGSETERRGRAGVILATGNSQLPFIEALRARADIHWPRINIFQMDEYLGMRADHPASFRRYLKDRLVAHVHPEAFYGLEGDADPIGEEIERYSRLLDEHQPVVCVLGIGENGHLAFNDPPADLTTERSLKVVTLDPMSRKQQVGEGHFRSVDETPTHAVTLTVHALLRPRHVLAIVPEARKAAAVRTALEGPITPYCPASILRRTPHARLFLDRQSAAGLSQP